MPFHGKLIVTWRRLNIVGSFLMTPHYRNSIVPPHGEEKHSVKIKQGKLFVSLLLTCGIQGRESPVLCKLKIELDGISFVKSVQ